MTYPTATACNASNAVFATTDGYNSKIVCTKYENWSIEMRLMIKYTIKFAKHTHTHTQYFSQFLKQYICILLSLMVLRSTLTLKGRLSMLSHTHTHTYTNEHTNSTHTHRHIKCEKMCQNTFV